MTMKIKVMHDKKARFPGAWNPMSILNTEQCWLLKKNYLHAAVFSSRKKKSSNAQKHLWLLKIWTNFIMQTSKEH